MNAEISGWVSGFQVPNLYNLGCLDSDFSYADVNLEYSTNFSVVGLDFYRSQSSIWPLTYVK